MKQMASQTITESVSEVCHATRKAAHKLAALDAADKNRALEAIANALIERTSEILAANAIDMQAAKTNGLDAVLLDRLALDADRLAIMAEGVREIAALPDPVGEIIDGRELPNGLRLRKLLVPLGVVAVIYEARPNVTIDAAALCLKSGNGVVLRGSSAAMNSNIMLAQVASEAATAAGLPADAMSLLASGNRKELAELATQTKTVDLIIPRGGEGLKAALSEVATVPVIYAASGNCHIYVDRSADFEQAQAIIINAKTQRPGVCNAVEKLLVHSDIASEFIPKIVRSLLAAGVEVRADSRGRALAGDLSDGVIPATDADWDTEYLAMIIAIRVVDSSEQAIELINQHGSGHSEAIVTNDSHAAHAFEDGVDAACVYINASTRFTDGGEFGMGAEIGNSTQKLHARGPIGLRELCTYKYLLEGDGQIRE
jgi:glutamate-5-semialdehyde dehydrogenase